MLGLEELEPNRTTLEIYNLYFERPFITQTHNYYTNESAQRISENSMIDYMLLCEVRLNQEESRVEHYLDASTLKAVRIHCTMTR